MTEEDEVRALKAWYEKFGIDKDPYETIRENKAMHERANKAFIEKFGENKNPDFIPVTKESQDAAQRAWDELIKKQNAKI